MLDPNGGARERAPDCTNRPGRDGGEQANLAGNAVACVAPRAANLDQQRVLTRSLTPRDSIAGPASPGQRPEVARHRVEGVETCARAGIQVVDVWVGRFLTPPRPAAQLAAAHPLPLHLLGRLESRSLCARARSPVKSGSAALGRKAAGTTSSRGRGTCIGRCLPS